MQLNNYLIGDRPEDAGAGRRVHYRVETLRVLVPDKTLMPTTIRQSVLAGKFKEGADLRKVQVFAGHREISFTERYWKTDLEELRRAVERFHPLDNSTKH